MMNGRDVWGQLWDRATSQPGKPAWILVDPEDAGEVVLEWPDGSRSALHYDDGDWRYHRSLSTFRAE